MKIMKETLPDRCEICHQSDCFNQYQNSCFRCKNFKNLIEKKQVNTIFNKFKLISIKSIWFGIAFTLVGIVASFLSSQILTDKVYGGVEETVILTIIAVIFSMLGGYYLCPVGFELIVGIYRVYKKNNKKLPKP